MEKKLNYDELSEITVKTQQELDSIPLDFEGKIYVEFGTCFNRAIVKNKYLSSVVARENSSVEAWENSSVEAWGNSSVVARENSSVVARGNSSVVAWGNSSVVARENSSVEAWGNSSVEARGNSSVEAWGNSSVEARGNSQIVDYLQGAKIQISGNARVIYMPRNIFEFMDFYGIKHTKRKAIFYKAVRKIDNKYCADRNNNFIYEIGKQKEEICEQDSNKDCGYGIHISHLNWALDYGSDWDNLAIIEVETDIKDILLPKNTNGKVRTCKVNVLREIPLEKCGIYGRILAQRKK